MSSTVKCSSCNIVIDELLAYIQNKISVVPEPDLIKICVSAFNSDEIKTSKTLLFESLPTDKRKIIRKREGRENRDIRDILGVFKSADVEVIPTFVARNLDKLPPVTFDSLDVTKLLKDITLLRADVDVIKSNYVTMDTFEDLKNDVSSKRQSSIPTQSIPVSPCFRSINLKRGACFDSGPMGLPHLDSTVLEVDCKNVQSSSVQNKDLNMKSGISPNESNNERDRENKVAFLSPVTAARETGSAHQLSDRPAAVCDNSAGVSTQMTNERKTFTEVVKTYKYSQQTSQHESDNQWQIAQSKKRKNRSKTQVRSKIGSASDLDGKFKAADTKIPIFITKVHKDTQESDICTYIMSKTYEKVVLQKLNIKRQDDHNAYKFFVNKEKLQLFLDSELWPKGIIFKRFVHYKQRTWKDMDAANGPKQRSFNG